MMDEHPRASVLEAVKSLERYYESRDPVDKVIEWNRLSSDYDIEFWPDNDSYPEYCLIEIEEGRSIPVRPPSFEEVVYANNVAEDGSMMRDTAAELLRYAEVCGLEQATVYMHNGRVAYRDDRSSGDDRIIYTDNLSAFLSLEDVAESIRTWELMEGAVSGMWDNEEQERSASDKAGRDWESLTRMLEPFEVGRIGDRRILHEERDGKDTVYLLDRENRSVERADSVIGEEVRRKMGR